jgi:hypothetical protein
MSTTERPFQPRRSRALPGVVAAEPSLVLQHAVLAAGVAGILACLLFVVGPPGGDAAAHAYETLAFREQGWRMWDNYWYAGRYDLVNYSMLYYPLAAYLGQAVVVGASVMGGAGAFALVAHRLGARRPLPAIMAFAASWSTVVVAGQHPFALGMVAALVSLVFWLHRRPLLGLAAAFVALLATPLAFLFLAIVLAGAAIGSRKLFAERRMRIAVAGVLLVGLGELVIVRLFPSGGQFPYPALDFASIVLFCVAGIVLARRSAGLTAVAGPLAAYLVAGVAVAVYPASVGGNVARLVTYTALPTMLLLLGDRGFRPRVLSAAVLGVAALGVVGPIVRNLQGGLAERADSPAFWDRALTWLDDPSHRDPNYRVEAVGTWGHWESYYLAVHDIPITRGWFRQDDFPVNQPLYSRTLDPATFQAWLRSLGVRYVVLPNEELDYSSEQEAQILRSPGHGGLKLVSGDDPNVQIFELPDPTPILTAAAGGPAVAAHATAPIVHYLDRSSIAMALPAMGIYDLRVRYTPYWVSSDPAGVCVMPGGDGMTRLVAYRGGYVRLRFDVTLGESARQALGERNASCPALPAGTPGRF